ncbi:hypothetical protein JOY44_15150 [Phormidium sp. CLA17]|uniref:hypothetical protein n=1 Tax=Leptolyngbya sp. Cla-17 TaxID=2803751 RepID=UPI001490A20E|nr:hypothetical protein [Leptolyngbya sp. Cla-17]MBM0742928.1 hypothetical protein [Leptolyngbya sp. Cla-17]
MSQKLNPDDLLILEKLRLGRLCSFFPGSLARCFLHIDANNRLTIDCFEPWVVDELLSQSESLCQCIWLTTGASSFALYFNQEEIYQAATHSTSSLTLHE